MSNVAALARDWLAIKATEAACIKSRIAIEEQLVAALGARDEGSETHTVPGYKIVLTQPVYRKVDEKEWLRVASKCPPELAPVRTKLEADATGMKWLLDNDPAVWRRIAGAFTSTPGKVSVKVEVEK